MNKQQLRSKWGKVFWHRDKKRNDWAIKGNLAGIIKGTERELQVKEYTDLESNTR